MNFSWICANIFGLYYKFVTFLTCMNLCNLSIKFFLDEAFGQTSAHCCWVNLWVTVHAHFVTSSCVVLVSRRENEDVSCKNGLPTSVWPLLQPQSIFSHGAFLPTVLVWVPGYLLLVFEMLYHPGFCTTCGSNIHMDLDWKRRSNEDGEVTKIEKEEKLYKLSLNLEVNFFIISHILIYNLITKIKGKKLTSEGQSQGRTFY